LKRRSLICRAFTFFAAHGIPPGAHQSCLALNAGTRRSGAIGGPSPVKPRARVRHPQHASPYVVWRFDSLQVGVLSAQQFEDPLELLQIGLRASLVIGISGVIQPLGQRIHELALTLHLGERVSR